MSQAGVIDSSGIAPGDVRALVTDDGGIVTPVLGKINVLGYKANTVQTMRTYKTADGVLQIADQTWQTQYVVDASTTNGLRGTFTTIQSAINQASADGGGGYRKVFIRPGTYIENLTIPTGIILEGDNKLDINGGNNITTIQGTHSIAGGATVYFNNINFSNNGNAEIFLITTDPEFAVFSECTFTSTGAAAIFTDSTSGGTQTSYSFFNCLVIKVGYTGYDFEFSLSGGEVYFSNVIFGLNPPSPLGSYGAKIKLNANTKAYFDNCAGINSIDTNATSYLECYDSSFTSTSTNTPAYFISGAGTGYLSDCDFGSGASSSVFPSSGSAIQNTTGPWVISGLTSYGGLIYENGTVITEGQSTQGDVIQTKASAVSYVASINDFYIGITDTSSARTVTLPDPSTVTEGKMFYIKDESGAAGTFAITISVSGGATIDGVASQVINSNYGSSCIVKRGSVYYVI